MGGCMCICRRGNGGGQGGEAEYMGQYGTRREGRQALSRLFRGLVFYHSGLAAYTGVGNGMRGQYHIA